MDFIEREREAASLWTYEVALVPGLLQTRAYAQALIDDALMGPMVLVEGQDHERFAFMEGAFASELSADPGVVSRVTERLSMIRTRALDPDESARLIERMVNEP